MKTTIIHIMEQLKWSLLKLKIINQFKVIMVIMIEYQNTETFLLKGLVQIGLKKFL